MRYFKKSDDAVYGYDEDQQALIDQAIEAGWEEVTGSWPPPPAPVEITQVTMRQARLALLQAGLLDAVEAHITTPEQRIWWDYSTVVEKNNVIVTDVTTALGITEQQVTDLFELAATL